MPAASQVVDVQMRPIFEYRVIRLPLPESTREDDDIYERRLTGLSVEGFSILAQTATHLILGKTRRIEKLAVDVGRVILPVSAPV